MHLTIAELMTYTAEERGRWEVWFRANGEEVLSMPIAGGMETTVGQLVMHVFGPELRYVQRLRREVETDYRALPHGSVEAVFGFGIKTRNAMREFIAGLAPEDWDQVMEYTVRDFRISATIRKTICHVYIHEIRHWAQVARLVRERGFEPPGNHDLLMSAALE